MAAVHARFLLIKNKTTGVDPLVDSILAGDTQETGLYVKAREIYSSETQKMYVESSLIATQNLQEISDLLEIPLDVLSTYRQVFFNIEGFNKLQRLEVINDADSPDERAMKMWALSQGLDFISWRIGKPVSLNPVEGLKEMFTIATYKSKEAIFSANASESSKEATKWTKLSMDLARLLKAWVMDTDSARKDIELALKNVSPDFGSFDSLDPSDGEGEGPFGNASIADTSDAIDSIEGFADLDKE